MGLTETTNGVCDKIVNEFDKIVGPIQGASRNIQSSIRSLTNKLGKITFSLPDDLTDALDDLSDTIDSLIPDFDTDDIELILDMISSCSLLKDSSGLSNPISLVNGLGGSLTDSLKNKINDLANTVPELDVGGGLNNIIDQLSGGISSDMLNLDKAINCVSSLCPGFGSQLSDMVDMANDLYSMMGIVDDPLSSLYGQLDLDSIYSAAGIGATKIQAMKNTMNSISETTNNVTDSISNGVEKTKEYMAENFDDW